MTERARIAREMHDIVAHSVSMIAVQAETAPYTLETSTTGRSRILGDRRLCPRRTLTEMRRLLGVLRADIARDPETAPQPGWPAPRAPRPARRQGGPGPGRRAGAPCPGPWTSRPTGSSRRRWPTPRGPRPRRPGLDRADLPPGPAGAADRRRRPRPRRETPPDGHGLVGMRERARLLGGWFEAGPGTDRRLPGTRRGFRWNRRPRHRPRPPGSDSRARRRRPADRAPAGSPRCSARSPTSPSSARPRTGREAVTAGAARPSRRRAHGHPDAGDGRDRGDPPDHHGRPGRPGCIMI